MNKPEIEYSVEMYALPGMTKHRVKVLGTAIIEGKSYRAIRVCSASASELEAATDLLKYAVEVAIGQKFFQAFPLYLEEVREPVHE